MSQQTQTLDKVGSPYTNNIVIVTDRITTGSIHTSRIIFGSCLLTIGIICIIVTLFTSLSVINTQEFTNKLGIIVASLFGGRIGISTKSTWFVILKDQTLIYQHEEKEPIEIPINQINKCIYTIDTDQTRTLATDQSKSTN